MQKNLQREIKGEKSFGIGDERAATSSELSPTPFPPRHFVVILPPFHQCCENIAFEYRSKF